MKKTASLLGGLLFGICVAAHGQTCVTAPPKILDWFPGEGNATDIVGGHTGHMNGNTGTSFGHATFSPGLVGQAFDFGIGGFASFPHDDEWRLGGNDFTIELWVYFRTFPDPNPQEPTEIAIESFVGVDDGSSSNKKWFFGVHNTPENDPDPGGYKLALHLNDTCANTFNSGGGVWLGDTILYTFAPATNQWYHLAFVRSGDLFTIYVNGASIGSESHPGLFPVPDPLGGLIIGNLPNEASPQFDGLIDELTIYGRALCDSEINAIYTAGSAGKCPQAPPIAPPSGLAAWFPADKNADELVSGQTGTLNGGVTYSCTGKVGESFAFDGSTGYVEFPNSSRLGFTGPFSVEAWVNYTALPGTQGINIAAKGPDCQCVQDWALNISQNGKLKPHAQINGVWKNFECGTVLSAGVWYHVAMVYDGHTLSGYVNGRLDGSLSATGPVSSSVNSLRIGAYAPLNGSDSKCFFDGQIDELSLYNRALSSTEIQSIYNAGQVGKDIHSTWAPISGKVAWWPADQSCEFDFSFTDVVAQRAAVPQPAGATVNRVLGYVASAYSIDANDFLNASDVVNVNGSPVADTDLNPAGAISVECWVNRPAQLGIADPLIKKAGGATADNGYSLEFSGQKMAFWVFTHENSGGNTWTGAISSQVLLPNTWYHVVGVYDGTYVTCYVNGVPSTPVPANGPIIPSTNPLEIGHDSFNSRPFAGLIDEATVYCRALSADEVNRLYNLSHDGKPYATFTH
jgi:hypothetical protein